MKRKPYSNFEAPRPPSSTQRPLHDPTRSPLSSRSEEFREIEKIQKLRQRHFHATWRANKVYTGIPEADNPSLLGLKLWEWEQDHPGEEMPAEVRTSIWEFSDKDKVSGGPNPLLVSAALAKASIQPRIEPALTVSPGVNSSLPEYSGLLGGELKARHMFSTPSYHTGPNVTAAGPKEMAGEAISDSTKMTRGLLMKQS